MIVEVLLTAVLVSLLCSMSGVWLVLRKMSLWGDVVSHALLLAVVGGYLLTGSRALLPVLVVGVGVAVGASLLIEWLQKNNLTREDGAMGVVLSLSFAVGVILVSTFAAHVDLDQGCILFGELVFVPLERVVIAGYDLGPRAWWTLFPAGAIVALMTPVLVRNWTWGTFDPSHAKSLGFSVVLMDGAMSILTASIMIMTFELVGVVLVVAMMVLPSVVGRLCAQSVMGVIAVGSVYATIAAVGGTVVAIVADGALAPAIVMTGGVGVACIIAVVAIMKGRYAAH